MDRGEDEPCRPARLDLAISRAMRKLLEKDSDNEMRVVKLKNKMKRVFECKSLILRPPQTEQDPRPMPMRDGRIGLQVREETSNER
jgi:hypothetical protein